MIREAAEKTGDAIGDGTSTATILAHAIFAEGLKNVAAGASAVDLKRGLDRGLRVAVAVIQALSRPVESRKEKAQVAAISAHNDPTIGETVASAQSVSENDPGYIIASYSHILIKGWRRSLDNVAAFRFVERDKSYASLMGKPENVGVIGFMAFEERILHPLPWLEREGSAPVAKAFRTEVGSIGTEYGREIDFRAYYVPFLRSGNKQTISLYYDTVEALRAAGVPVDRPLPAPFPGDFQFAPPPPGYREK